MCLASSLGCTGGAPQRNLRTGSDFVYPLATPPRVANRPLHAVVDVVDVEVSQYGAALAAAALPPGCQRTERDGLLILRMVTDPSDLASMQRAAATHEAWIGPLIDAPIDDDWEPPVSRQDS